jgi:hypothetical protein
MITVKNSLDGFLLSHMVTALLRKQTIVTRTPTGVRFPGTIHL